MIHYLVQGDTGSQIRAKLSRKGSSEEVDITGASSLLKVRKEGQTSIAFSVTGVIESNTVDVVVFPLGDNMIGIEHGRYEGEIEVTFSPGPNETIETVYEIINIFIREEF